jgi:exodeoxyribonuclease V alpha subunit
MGGRIPRLRVGPVRAINVLCPMKRDVLGARSLSLALRKILTGDMRSASNRFGWTFDRGDKIMQIETNYNREVYNVDVGTVLRTTTVRRKARSRSTTRDARWLTALAKLDV